MKPEIMVVFAIYFGFALLEAFRTGLFRKAHQTTDDGIVEIVSTVATLGITQPTIVFLSASILNWLVPQHAMALKGLPYLVGLLAFFVFDDFVNYLYHRASHNTPFLYNLHRAHHNGEYMSIRVSFRNNIFYYLFAPHLWLSGTLIYLGLGWVYASYLVLRLLVSFSCHSDVCWDRPLYANKFAASVMWFVERIIVTPSAHHTHHGKHADDGITHYKGNYGNTLMVWDIILGTGHITRQYPEHYGVENLPPMSAAEQLLWPLVRRASESSNAADAQSGKRLQREATNA